MKKLSPYDLALIALGAALMTLCSWISVPAAVPFTLQTFAVCLTAAVLGWRRGLWSVGVYLLLGLFGVPVFSGFRAGPGALLGPTGGYLVGFLFTALLVGLGARRWKKPLGLGLFMALGLILCYAFGTAWFMLVYARNTGPIALGTALAWCVLPFLIPDGIKLLLAALLAPRLSKLAERGRTT